MKRSLPFARGNEGWRANLGFTLVELMTVTAVIAILAAIAIPQYMQYATKSHRVAAEACTAQYANYMERFYTTNLNYVSDSGGNAAAGPGTFDCASSQQTGLFYSYTASSSSAAYTVTATPINSQLTRDTLCGTLTLNQTGSRTDSGTGTVANCWQQ